MQFIALIALCGFYIAVPWDIYIQHVIMSSDMRLTYA